MSPASTRSNGGTIARLLLAIVFFAISVLLWVNQQYVIDQVAVWRYQPSSSVAVLADRAGLNDRGRFLYYASQPMIDGTQNFNQECDRKEQSTAILGCYTNNRIYIYNVTDTRLDGIKEVTAAHETLHAAYQRLSSSERDRVNKLVEAEYSKLLNDTQFKERMAFYERTEPGERDNELHSIIGTEVTPISSDLEDYYKTYFADRSKVVQLHDAYSAVFTQIDTQSKQLLDQLNKLGATIQAESSSYNTDVAMLNKDIQTFNQRAQAGSFASQPEFNSQRAGLVQRATALSSKRQAINNDIATYETLRTQYNQMATESKQLNDSINSTLAPAPSV